MFLQRRQEQLQIKLIHLQAKVTKKNNIILLFWLLLAVGILFLICNDPFVLFHKTIFYIFQERDFDRAQKIMAGKAVLFGPEMTGGGYLPGPLYYLLLSVALSIKTSWTSAWFMEFILVIIAAVSGAVFFQKRFSTLMALLWIVLFTSARFTSFFIGLFLNVSSMFPFVVGALICIHQLLDKKENINRNKYFYLCCLIIGVGIQFHFSLITLFFALLILMIFNKFFQIDRLPFRTMLLGFALLLLPSVPYLIWNLSAKFGHPFGEQGFYNGKSDEAVTSILYLLKVGLAAPWNKILKAWINKFLFSVPFAFLVIMLSIFLTRLIDKKNEIVTNGYPLRALIFLVFGASIPHLNWYFSTQAMRYSMPFYLALIFFTLILFHSVLTSEKNRKIFNSIGLLIQGGLLLALYFIPDAELKEFLTASILACAVIFGVHLFLNKRVHKKTEMSSLISIGLLITLTLTQKHLIYNTIGTDGYMPNSGDWKQTWKIIYSKTGWSYDEARRKIYYIGHHVNQAPELFLMGYENEIKKTMVDKTNIPDGFFVSNRFRADGNSIKKVRPTPLKWLLKQNLQQNIAAALKNGDIRLGDNLSPVNMIVPYWIENHEGLPNNLHNSGEGYHMSSDDIQLTQIEGPEGTKKISENEFLFKWNESPDQHPYCSTGALIKLKNESKGNYSIDLKIIGGTISQISPWVSPNWTQAWINPYLEIVCDQNSQNILITDSIGFRRDYSHFKWTPFFSGNNSLVGPMEKTVHFSCKGKIESIKLGREKSLVEMITFVKTLPSKELTLAL